MYHVLHSAKSRGLLLAMGRQELQFTQVLPQRKVGKAAKKPRSGKQDMKKESNICQNSVRYDLVQQFSLEGCLFRTIDG